MEHGYSYIFDLRCLPNPGRELAFKNLTGKDQQVADYLEKIPEVKSYYQNATALINLSIEEYLQRKFELLSISFGCTGGQHRSIYFAEKLAKDLKSRAGSNLKIKIEHLNINNIVQK
jgi:RNase adaptor protein for sRNA GlmZ degradation